jgi:hypothetical protein
MRRLGRNQGGYFGETINLVNVFEIEVTAVAHGWQSEVFFTGCAPVWAAASDALHPQFQPSLAFTSTGIHGMNLPDCGGAAIAARKQMAEEPRPWLALLEPGGLRFEPARE